MLQNLRIPIPLVCLCHAAPADDFNRPDVAYTNNGGNLGWYCHTKGTGTWSLKDQELYANNATSKVRRWPLLVRMFAMRWPVLFSSRVTVMMKMRDLFTGARNRDGGGCHAASRRRFVAGKKMGGKHNGKEMRLPFFCRLRLGAHALA